MLVKGLIVAIPSSLATDSMGNTCDVRIPLFEDVADNAPVIVYGAQILVQPGLYGNYKVDDVVWVDFENDKIEKAVIMGKLYSGNLREAEDFINSSPDSHRKGALQQASLSIFSDAVLPTVTVFSDSPNKVNSPKAKPSISTFSARQLYQLVESLQEENKQLKQELTTMKARLETLEKKV